MKPKAGRDGERADEVARRMEQARLFFRRHHANIEPDVDFPRRVAARLRPEPVHALGTAAARLLPASLVLVLILAGVGTALTNPDPLRYGPTALPALAPYEAVSMGIRDLIRYGVPFFLGRTLYRRSADLKDLLLVLAGAGVIYSAFILVELRLSPQFHRWIYGHHQHGFALHVRWGGYRPMVFMRHGLSVMRTARLTRD